MQWASYNAETLLSECKHAEHCRQNLQHLLQHPIELHESYSGSGTASWTMHHQYKHMLSRILSGCVIVYHMSQSHMHAAKCHPATTQAHFAVKSMSLTWSQLGLCQRQRVIWTTIAERYWVHLIRTEVMVSSFWWVMVIIWGWLVASVFSKTMMIPYHTMHLPGSRCRIIGLFMSWVPWKTASRNLHWLIAWRYANKW